MHDLQMHVAPMKNHGGGGTCFYALNYIGEKTIDFFKQESTYYFQDLHFKNKRIRKNLLTALTSANEILRKQKIMFQYVIF